MSAASSRLHYGWHIVWSGTLCIFAALGLGRFALGMMLPAMGQALSLSYAQMGYIGTGNFAGYLVAVLVCGAVAEKIGPRLLIATALLLVGVSMILIGQATTYWAILGLYTLTGIGSGAANVPMVSLVGAWFTRQQRGKAIGYVVIGSGFAILLAGKLVPVLNQSGAEGWRLSWQVLGMLVLTVALVCAIMLRNSPDRLGLAPYGSGKGASATPVLPQPSPAARTIVHLGAIYFLFGFTYVIFATFIVTALIQDHGFNETAAGTFWAWVGGLSLFSGPVFGGLSDKIGRKTALMVVFAMQTAAYLLAAFKLPLAFLWLAIGCYGLVAWSIPSIMAALVGDYAGDRAARIFGLITFIFGWGQISGPAVAGWLAEASGSFSSSFLMAAAGTTLAILLAALLPGESKPRVNKKLTG